MTVAVSIIPFGYSTVKGKQLLEFAKNNPDDFYDPIDIRQLMPVDPNSRSRVYKVGHEENADYRRTQLSLLADKRFFSAVNSLVEKIEEKTSDAAQIGKILPVGCTTGNHRADGSSKACASVLNNVVVGTERVWNVKVFGVNQTFDIKQAIKEATRWIVGSWTLAGPDEWGKDAAEDDGRAFTTFGWLQDLARIKSGDVPIHGLSIVDGMPLQPLSDNEEEEEQQLEQNDKNEAPKATGTIPIQAKAQPKTPTRPLKHAPPKYPPPPPPPKGSAAVLGYAEKRASAPATRGSVYKRQKTDDDDEDRDVRDDAAKNESAEAKWRSDDRWSSSNADWKSTGASTGDWKSTGASSWKDDARTESMVNCWCCQGSGRVPESSSFASFEQDPRVWRDLLSARGADETAMASIFVCAQHSWDGWKHACDLILKILKKEGSGHDVASTSRYIMNGCKEFMHRKV